MPIYVSDLSKQLDGRWIFHISGLYGRGRSAQLETDAHGRGLSLSTVDALILESQNSCEPVLTRQLIPIDLWKIASDANLEIALRQLVNLLVDLGWGPLVDRDGQITQSRPSAFYQLESAHADLLALYSARSADLLLRVLARDIAPNWKVSEEVLAVLTQVPVNTLRSYSAAGCICPLTVDQIERISHAIDLYVALVSFFQNADIAGEWMHMPNSLSILTGKSALKFLLDQRGNPKAWTLVHGLVARASNGHHF